MILFRNMSHPKCHLTSPMLPAKQPLTASPPHPPYRPRGSHLWEGGGIGRERNRPPSVGRLEFRWPFLSGRVPSVKPGASSKRTTTPNKRKEEKPKWGEPTRL